MGRACDLRVDEGAGDEIVWRIRELPTSGFAERGDVCNLFVPDT
jgi:hypothetical protein